MALVQYYVMVWREALVHRVDRGQIVLFVLFAIGGLPGLASTPGGVRPWHVVMLLAGSAVAVRWTFAHFWLWHRAWSKNDVLGQAS